MEQRNKYWRRQHTERLFKQRMMLRAAFGDRIFVMESGTWNRHPHWFELAKERWCKVYKTTGRPCSCPICKHERYNRRANKKDTARIIRESQD